MLSELAGSGRVAPDSALEPKSVSYPKALLPMAREVTLVGNVRVARLLEPA